MQRALGCEATRVETIRVTHAVRLLREVAERQAIRNSEEGFRLQLQQDLEKHANFTHTIVSGKGPPMQLPTESLHGVRKAGPGVVADLTKCP